MIKWYFNSAILKLFDIIKTSLAAKNKFNLLKGYIMNQDLLRVFYKNIFFREFFNLKRKFFNGYILVNKNESTFEIVNSLSNEKYFILYFKDGISFEEKSYKFVEININSGKHKFFNHKVFVDNYEASDRLSVIVDNLFNNEEACNLFGMERQHILITNTVYIYYSNNTLFKDSTFHYMTHKSKAVIYAVFKNALNLQNRGMKYLCKTDVNKNEFSFLDLHRASTDEKTNKRYAEESYLVDFMLNYNRNMSLHFGSIEYI